MIEFSVVMVGDGPMPEIPLPTVEEATAMLADAEAERNFWNAHRAEFMQKYPEQFVVVLDGVVIAADSDLCCLEATLHSLSLTFRDVWFQYVPTSPRAYLL